KALSNVVADTQLSGTLVSGLAPVVAVSGTTLTLTPAPNWHDDSGLTLQVIAHDPYGNASAPLIVTYDVRAGGVYVRGDGNDSNLGTRSAPLLTVAHGLSVAAAAYPPPATPAVRVAAGTYNEQVTVPAGVQLLGGYSVSDWSAPASRSGNPTYIQTTVA